LLFFNGFLEKSQGFSFGGLFFLSRQFHGLAAAMKGSLPGDYHLYLVSADFTDVDLPDFVRHFNALLSFIRPQVLGDACR
jgi:hypothetical protein